MEHIFHLAERFLIQNNNDTLPFHLFAYVPFWNYLRFPKQITAVLLIAIQFLYMGLILIMVHADISTSQAQLIAIPIYGGLLFLLVKLDYGKIVFLYIESIFYQKKPLPL